MDFDLNFNKKANLNILDRFAESKKINLILRQKKSIGFIFWIDLLQKLKNIIP
jgi:hypothetical protein